MNDQDSAMCREFRARGRGAADEAGSQQQSALPPGLCRGGPVLDLALRLEAQLRQACSRTSRGGGWGSARAGAGQILSLVPLA